MTLTARDLPEIRAELAVWLTDPSPTGGPAVWSAHHDDPAVAVQERRAAAGWAHALRIADLYYIGADMARLAVAAGQALPSYRLHLEDLPARSGLIVWQEPVAEAYEGGEYTGAPITAATWRVSGNRVHVRTWATQDEWLRFMAAGDERAGLRTLSGAEVRQLRLRHPQPIVSLHTSYLPFGRVPGWLRQAPDDTSTMSLVELESRANSLDQLEQAERALVVSWLLMGQTLVREELVEAPRAAMKRIGRLDPALLTSVRYVQLRHRSIHADERGQVEGAGRVYSHRWVVRGHWRNQYYPSRGDHRPVWISDHVKGPDGAPILDPDKLVHVLRR